MVRVRDIAGAGNYLSKEKKKSMSLNEGDRHVFKTSSTTPPGVMPRVQEKITHL